MTQNNDKLSNQTRSTEEIADSIIKSVPIETFSNISMRQMRINIDILRAKLTDCIQSERKKMEEAILFYRTQTANLSEIIAIRDIAIDILETASDQDEQKLFEEREKTAVIFSENQLLGSKLSEAENKLEELWKIAHQCLEDDQENNMSIELNHAGTWMIYFLRGGKFPT